MYRSEKTENMGPFVSLRFGINGSIQFIYQVLLLSLSRI